MQKKKNKKIRSFNYFTQELLLFVDFEVKFIAFSRFEHESSNDMHR